MANQVFSYPIAAMDCMPELCAKMCEIENDILYNAMYSPCLPFLARSKANALENGNKIISPTVISNIPMIKTISKFGISSITKLEPTKKLLIIIKAILDLPE